MTEKTAYDIPRPATDQVIASLYQEHDLGEVPTMGEIKPVAIGLLGDVLTMIDGAQMVLGRYVGAEDLVLRDIMNPSLSAEDRFALLLLRTAIESEELSVEDLKAKAILIATDWISKNRPDLTPYIRDYGLFMASERGGKFYVSAAVNGPKGYEYFSFWVDVEDDTVQQVKKT